MMQYKGYIGVVEFDNEAAIFHGDVVNTRDAITFQGKSVAEITKAFRESVDDYLEFCKARGEEPDKPFSGKLVLRMEPALHRTLAIAARREKKSLNSLIVEKLEHDYHAKA
ncbi:MAG: antitoxin HicB [Betaproteobacteria bacterium RIFCSPLOWO2_12_FULL_62_58]|nr:MAG: antitoxin HicB [Betaproteobacteria bacterium RIFCSPLOWO2_12_FULL_62_58]